MNQKNEMRATIVAIVALVIAVAASALAWVAYDRTGENLEHRIQEGINQRISGTDEAPATAGTHDESSPSDTPNTDTSTVPQTQP